MLPFLVAVPRHAQSTQNNKLIVSLPYLKIEVKGTSIVCVQINIKVFCMLILGMSKEPKLTGLQYLKNNILDFVDLLFVNALPSLAESIQQKQIYCILRMES